MSGMNSMLVMVAKMAPIEFIINNLEEELKRYKQLCLTNAPASEKKQALDKLTFACVLLVTCQTEGNAIDLIDEFEQLDKLHNMMKPGRS